MIISVITDCNSPNDIGRQQARYAGLFGSPISFVPVPPSLNQNAELIAGGQLIDVLDAASEFESIIVVNIAPRGNTSSWKNGCPFTYFRYKNSLVITSLSETIYGFIRKFKLSDEVQIVELEENIHNLGKRFNFDPNRISRIINTQFRSFEFVPYLAKYMSENLLPISTKIKITESNFIQNKIWYIDDFGNCKTTLLSDEVKVQVGEMLETKLGKFMLYNRLKDIPENNTGYYFGSSGLDTFRFLEFGVQKGNASSMYRISVGDAL